MAHVASIAYKPADAERRPHDHFTRVTVERAELVAGRGMVGDAKARQDSRQLNVLLAETVEQLRAEGFRTAPGELGEQLVIAGLATETIGPGVRLRIGRAAVIELVYYRVPCTRFERIQGQPKHLVSGRIGFMARVLVGGEVAVGSPVSVEPRAETGILHESSTADPVI